MPEKNVWRLNQLTGGENGRQIEIVIDELSECHGHQGQIAAGFVQVRN